LICITTAKHVNVATFTIIYLIFVTTVKFAKPRFHFYG